MIASANSVQGVVFFIGLTIGMFVLCLFSHRARLRLKENLGIITLNFFLEYFLADYIQFFIEIQKIRFMVICILGVLIHTAKDVYTRDDRIS